MKQVCRELSNDLLAFRSEPALLIEMLWRPGNNFKNRSWHFCTKINSLWLQISIICAKITFSWP